MKRYTNIKSFSRKVREFGLFIPLSNLLLTYGRKLPPSFLKRIATKRNELIQKKLFKLIGNSITEPKEATSRYESNAPIWFYWMQGEKNMPPIPKLCLNSLRKHANGHPVILLDADNVNQYVNIPFEIAKAYQTGKLKQAHYADIIRIML